VHPPEEGHVIHLDAPLSEEFLEIAIGEAVEQVPAHSEDDDLGREPEPLNAAFGTADTGRQRRSSARVDTTALARRIEDALRALGLTDPTVTVTLSETLER
jgi:hypothetical protein